MRVVQSIILVFHKLDIIASYFEIDGMLRFKLLHVTRKTDNSQHPTRPVENVALTMKGLLQRKTQLLNGTTVEK